jgi:DNA-binding transcriptional ArsR family regulator
VDETVFLVSSNRFLPLCRKSVIEALHLLLLQGEVSINALVAHGFSRKSAWQTITCLRKAEFVARSGWGKYRPNKFVIRGGEILLNPYDGMLELIFRSRPLRRILKAKMAEPSMGVGEISSMLGISTRTVLRAARDLQKAGILSEDGQLQSVYEPKSQIERLPRSLHREAISHFLKCLEAYGSSGIPSAIIVFGPAAEGLPLQPIGVACLTSLVQRADEHSRLAFALALAKENVEGNFKLNINPIIVVENAYLAARLGILAEPNALLKYVAEGICVYGKTPNRDDYFEILNKIAPLTVEDLKEKVEKGYVVHTGGRYVFTEKAIETFRKRAPTHISETYIPIDKERKIDFITVGKPAPSL